MIHKSETIPAIIGFVIAIMISVVGYMWAQQPPVELYQRYPSQTAVIAGDRVTITWEEVRDGMCNSIVHRRLIAADKTITEFEPARIGEKPINETIHSEFSFIVPPGLAEGPLIYRASAEFHCNVVQKLFGGPTFVLPDIVFTYHKGPLS